MGLDSDLQIEGMKIINSLN